MLIVQPVTLPNAATSIEITDIFEVTHSDFSADPGPDCLEQVECFFEDDQGLSHSFKAQSGFVSPNGGGAVPLVTIECGIQP